MTGYRTMVSILISILGGLGFFQRIGATNDEVAQVADLVISAIAGLVALYFNYKNHQELERAGTR